VYLYLLEIYRISTYTVGIVLSLVDLNQVSGYQSEIHLLGNENESQIYFNANHL